MAKKEPLYPHVPKKEPLYPHVPKSRQVAKATVSSHQEGGPEPPGETFRVIDRGGVEHELDIRYSEYLASLLQFLDGRRIMAVDEGYDYVDTGKPVDRSLWSQIDKAFEEVYQRLTSSKGNPGVMAEHTGLWVVWHGRDAEGKIGWHAYGEYSWSDANKWCEIVVSKGWTRSAWAIEAPTRYQAIKIAREQHPGAEIKELPERVF